VLAGMLTGTTYPNSPTAAENKQKIQNNACQLAVRSVPSSPSNNWQLKQYSWQEPYRKSDCQCTQCRYCDAMNISRANIRPKLKRQTRSALATSLKQVVVVELVIVDHDFALDLGRVHPGHVILQVPGHMEGGIGHSVRADPHVALLNEGGRFSKVLTHAQPHKHDR
jgi:hypothetical protein